LLLREGPSLHVRGVDMLDGTPVLDIKPYLSGIPSEKLRRGWLAEAEKSRDQATPAAKPPGTPAGNEGTREQENGD
jgi:tRNA (Thr-GGU) A37 N-methylase